MLVVNQELSTALSGVKHEQEYMQVRSSSLLRGSVREKWKKRQTETLKDWIQSFLILHSLFANTPFNNKWITIYFIDTPVSFTVVLCDSLNGFQASGCMLMHWSLKEFWGFHVGFPCRSYNYSYTCKTW